MPVGQPVLGEQWETRDLHGRAVRGIVADVTPTVITFVSLTGSRYRVSPSRLSTSWAFVSAAPRTPFVCSRRGCSLTAVFLYSRGTSPDYTCPRHAPAGTHLNLLRDQPGAPQSQPAPAITIVNPCPNCGHPDPVELWSGHEDLPEVSGWSCVQCNNAWSAVVGGANPNTNGQWWRGAVATAIHDIERHKRRPSQIRCHPTVYDLLRAEVDAFLSTENGDLEIFHTPTHPDSTLDPWTLIIYTGTRRLADEPNQNGDVFSRDLLMQQFRAIARSATNDRKELEQALVRPKSRWVHKSTGASIETISVKDGAVVFRQEDQNATMLLEDFVKFHRPFVFEGISTEPIPNIAILPGEEWESAAEGTVTIVSVDSKREQVTVAWADGRKRSAPLTLREFGTDKWRKVIRKTSFQRLLDLDEDD